MKLSNLTRSEGFFNIAALISLLASIAIWFSGHPMTAIFIGLWVPSIIGWMNFFTSQSRVLENQREVLREERRILEEMRALSAGGGSSGAGASASDAPGRSESSTERRAA